MEFIECKEWPALIYFSLKCKQKFTGKYRLVTRKRAGSQQKVKNTTEINTSYDDSKDLKDRIKNTCPFLPYIPLQLNGKGCRRVWAARCEMTFLLFPNELFSSFQSLFAFFLPFDCEPLFNSINAKLIINKQSNCFN